MARFSAIDSVWSNFGDRSTEESRKAAVQRFAEPTAVVAAPEVSSAPLDRPVEAAPPLARLLRERYDAFDEAVDLSCRELLPTARLVGMIVLLILFGLLISLHCKLSKITKLLEASPPSFHPMMMHAPPRW